MTKWRQRLTPSDGGLQQVKCHDWPTSLLHRLTTPWQPPLSPTSSVISVQWEGIVMSSDLIYVTAETTAATSDHQSLSLLQLNARRSLCLTTPRSYRLQARCVSRSQRVHTEKSDQIIFNRFIYFDILTEWCQCFILHVILMLYSSPLILYIVVYICCLCLLLFSVTMWTTFLQYLCGSQFCWNVSVPHLPPFILLRLKQNGTLTD